MFLLNGLGLGSLLAFLLNALLSRRPRQAALGQTGGAHVPSQLQWAGQQAQAVPVMAPSGAVQMVPLTGGALPALLPPSASGPPAASALDAPAAEASAAEGSGAPVARLDELAGYVRRHVEETREATSALRRTLEQQQRQYQTALSDFQRKVDEASKKKPVSALPRMEIAPESMKMLKSLINPALPTNGSVEAGEGGEALRQWFTQVEDAMKRLLRAAPSQAEAKKSLQTLSLIVSNLVSTGGAQEKYREVNTASNRFREQFGSSDGGAAELLQFAGFDRRDQGFVFPIEGQQRGLEKAERVRDFLQAALRDCDQRWEQAQAEAGTTAPSAAAEPAPPTMDAAVARPPWASSSSSTILGASSASAGPATVNGNAPASAGGVAAAQAAEVQPAADPLAQAGPNAASSSRSGTAARAPAPWHSSALTRGLSRLPNGPGGSGGETVAEAAGAQTAAAHPAESAGQDETQRLPG